MNKILINLDFAISLNEIQNSDDYETTMRHRRRILAHNAALVSIAEIVHGMECLNKRMTVSTESAKVERDCGTCGPCRVKEILERMAK